MKCTFFSFCFWMIFFSVSISTMAQAQETAEQLVVSTQILQTSTAWNSKQIEYPAGNPEVTALHIEFAAGSETTWHRHPVPSLAYIISGELEVTLKDGKTEIFKTGDAFAEVVNTWHYGKNIGDEPVKLVVFYIGKKGENLTELLDENPHD